MDNYKDTKNFSCLDEMICHAINNLDDSDEYMSIGIIIPCGTVHKVLHRILSSEIEGCSYFDLYSLKYHAEDYPDEYVITIDNELRVWCEPMKYCDRYVNVICDLCYLHGDVSHRVEDYIDADEIILSYIE